MKFVYFLIGLVILLIVVLVFINKESLSKPPIIAYPSATIIPTKSVLGQIKSTIPSRCHTDGVLPDPNCTPGVVDPNVTQNNIFQTICVKGYTKTIRPPVDYTNRLKQEQIIEYGYQDSNVRLYEEDHLISLELGGAPSDPKNLWPEPGASPNPKDKIENLCHEKVCSGQISLADAQHQIATNWPTACQ